MCGFVAISSPRGVVESARIEAALGAMEHRGPDGSGVFMSADRSVGLGHVRLAIIGLSDGAQPIASEDDSVQIVVNGEFYDFERIRKELESRGHVFRTMSDSEVALHLYEEHGVDCLAYLRGEFAFVIHDERRNLLFAARDRFGIKPFVFSHFAGTLYMASEAKALFAAGVPAQWDEESFFHAANLQYVLPDRTLFKGVHQLRPGHYLVARGESIETACYWDLGYGAEEGATERGGRKLNAGGIRKENTSYGAGSLTGADEDELISQFRHKLSQSVRLRLRADIPVCCHLSGGLDSSAVLGLAAEHAGSPIQCFSVTFDEESYDEKEIASRMARHAGAEFHPVRVTEKEMIEHLADAVYYSEGFAVNGHLPAKFLLHKAIRKAGYKVALTGEGSDELVAGYAHLRTDLFRAEGREDLVATVAATNSASRGIMLKHGESLVLDAVARRLSFVPSFLEAKGSLGFKLCSVLEDGFRSRFAGTDCYDILLGAFNFEGQLKGRHPVNQSLYLWTKTALANYILRTLGDGTEMASAVEGRVPFLDHELFEFVRTLPVSLKIRGMTEKYVLREAVKNAVTDEIYTRQKHPFVAPPMSRFADSGSSSLLRDELSSRDFDGVPFFDRSKLLSMLDELPSMKAEDRAAFDPVFMTALSALALKRRFHL